MTLYKIISFILFSFLSFQVMAQEEVNLNLKDHIVNLHNGSALIGIILDYGQGRPAKVQMSDGEIIEVPHNSIQSIEPISELRKHKIKFRKSKDAAYSFSESGWHYNTNLGYISRGPSFGGHGIAAEVGVTYHINRLLGLGISTGYDSYSNGDLQDFIPIHVTLTGYLSPNKTTLFYSLSAGHAFAVTEVEDSEWFKITSKGGIGFFPKVGVRLSGHEGINITLFSGIKIQKSSF